MDRNREGLVLIYHGGHHSIWCDPFIGQHFIELGDGSIKEHDSTCESWHANHYLH